MVEDNKNIFDERRKEMKMEEIVNRIKELEKELVSLKMATGNGLSKQPHRKISISKRAIRILMLSIFFVFGVMLTVAKAVPNSLQGKTFGFLFQTTKSDGSTKTDRLLLEANNNTVNAYFIATNVNAYADDATSSSKLNNSPQYQLTASGWNGTAALFKTMKIYNVASNPGSGDWSSSTPYELRIDNDAGTNLLTLKSTGELSLISTNAQIKNVANPIANQDAATKKYVDDCVGSGSCGTGGGAGGWIHNTTGQHLIYPHATGDLVVIGAQAQLSPGYYLQIAGNNSIFAQGNLTIAPSGDSVTAATIKGTSGAGAADIFQVQSSGGINYLKISSTGDATIGDSTARNQAINGTLIITSPNGTLTIQ